MLVTGGKVEKGPNIPAEAEVMKKMAVGKGIPASSIIKEAKALSTFDNAYFSKDILDYRGACFVTVISSEFHMERVKTIFKSIYLRGKGAQFYKLDFMQSVDSVEDSAKEAAVEAKMMQKMVPRLIRDGFQVQK